MQKQATTNTTQHTFVVNVITDSNISQTNNNCNENRIKKGKLISSQSQEENQHLAKYERWTKREDLKLKEIVLEKGTKDWDNISEYFEEKTGKQCKYRWYKFIKPSLKDFSWTEEEDKFLCHYIANYGTTNWTICSKMMQSKRTAMSCKERWYKVLSLKTKNEKHFSPKEDLALLLLVNKLGTCWSKIVTNFPLKTENKIKNRCYSILRNFACEFLNKNKSSNKIKSADLKANELIQYIPYAIDSLRKISGEETYQEICQTFLIGEKSVNNNEKENHSCSVENSNGKLSINMCNICRGKLKDHLKKKILTKIIQKQINTCPTDFFDSNAFFNQGFNLTNTLTKIESVKELLSNFIHNI